MSKLTEKINKYFEFLINNFYFTASLMCIVVISLILIIAFISGGRLGNYVLLLIIALCIAVTWLMKSKNRLVAETAHVLSVVIFMSYLFISIISLLFWIVIKQSA